jgi:ribosomal protein S18 acetylase RimI-like enzyme
MARRPADVHQADAATVTDPYSLVPTAPGVDDYLRLRIVAGLSPKSREGAEIGLPNGWYGVTILYEGRAVAMGRIIGDGGTAFQIVDMAVEPEHQGKGLGKRIMAALVAELESRAPAGAYVSLVADGDAQHLYAKYGFEPVTPKSIGMARWAKRP